MKLISTRRTGRPLREYGQVLFYVLLSTLVVLFLGPTLVKYLQNESVQSVHFARTSASLQLAQSVADRINPLEIFDQAYRGETVPGWSGDVTYSDPQGQYKLFVTTTPNTFLDTGGPTCLAVTVVARGNSGTQPRAIEDTYCRSSLGYLSYLMGVTGTQRLHWAPAYTWSIPPNSVGLHYPRKVSNGAMSPLDSSGAAPNTDGKEYWAYSDGSAKLNELKHSCYVTLDHNYYIDRAMKSTVPVSLGGGTIGQGLTPGGPAARGNPAGSGYFHVSENSDTTPLGVLRFDNYVLSDPNAVIYSHCDILLGPGTFLDVELVMVSSLTVEAPGVGIVQATVPATADQEYLHALAAPIWDAPMQTAWSQPDRCCYTVSNVNISGYVFFEAATLLASTVIVGNLTPSDPSGIINSGPCKSTTNQGSGNLTVYFQQDATARTKFSDGSHLQRFHRRSTSHPWGG